MILTKEENSGKGKNSESENSEIGILLPKLFCSDLSSDREKLLKFEAEGREFAKFLRSLEKFIQTVKVQNNLNSNWKILGFRNIPEKLEKLFSSISINFFG